MGASNSMNLLFSQVKNLSSSVNQISYQNSFVFRKYPKCLLQWWFNLVEYVEILPQLSPTELFWGNCGVEKSIVQVHLDLSACLDSVKWWRQQREEKWKSVLYLYWITQQSQKSKTIPNCSSYCCNFTTLHDSINIMSAFDGWLVVPST